MNLLRVISNLLRFDRTNWKALALCVVAAVVFWIFNALNKDHITNVSFPIQFEFDNVKYATSQPLPARIVLNVGGNGWELLRKGIGMKVPPISLPLERPTEVHKIPGSTLSPQIASQLGALKLNFIVTDTLRLYIEPRVIRKMKLVADLQNVTFKKNFARISPVVILPDSVQLEGPRSFIEERGDTLRLKVSASRISTSFRESIEVLVDNNEFISRNPPVADVIFEVAPVEEIVYRLKLTVPKMSSGIELSDDSIRCVLIVFANKLIQHRCAGDYMIGMFHQVNSFCFSF